MGDTPYPLAGSLRPPIASPHSLWEAELPALLRLARRYGWQATALPARCFVAYALEAHFCLLATSALQA
ncbi:hypothetical protein PghCCS26_55680 [Paenibacillus glycanilyticus]|uniref:Uncharacterized protein n=1 Tax=Paenibacillus glycanilyticus TaxID=126569 RepID=A0ABQ6NU97_9BACL|nr:hypothetical protein PghCCS26_55680 [Paenibacillus glycanilyticus]